jgi:hypothetical protein
MISIAVYECEWATYSPITIRIMFISGEAIVMSIQWNAKWVCAGSTVLLVDWRKTTRIILYGNAIKIRARMSKR